jgi:hypothetical protein
VLPKRTLGIGLAVVAALLTTACAAGQHALTSEERKSSNGVNIDIGSIHIRGLVIEAPRGASYASGDNAQVKVVIVNVAHKDDLLTGVTSPAFADWGLFKSTADAGAALDPDPSSSAAVPAPGRQELIPAGGRVSWGVPEATGVLALFGFSDDVFPGTTIPMTFDFAQAGSVTLQVPIALSASPNTSPIPELTASVEA